MAISNAGAAQVGIRITAEGVVETTNGIKLTNDEILKLGKGLQQAANDGKAFTETQKQAASASDSYVQSLREQAATLGKTRAEALAWKGDQMALTEAQRESARASITQIAQYDAVQQKMKSLKETASSVAQAMGLSVAGIALGMAVAVKHQIDMSASTQTLSEKTGVAVEELSAMKYAADLSDTSMETLARSMAKFPKALVEAQNPNSAAGRAFSFLQIDPATITSTQDGYNKIADAVTRVQDPMAKAAALQMIFKSSGEELIPYFNNGSEGLRRLANEGRKWAEISGINAERAKQLQDNMVTLQYSTTELAKHFADTLVPALNAGAAAFLKNARDGNTMMGVLEGVRAMYGNGDSNEKHQAEKLVARKTSELIRAQNDLDALGRPRNRIEVADRADAFARVEAIKKEIKEAQALVAVNDPDFWVNRGNKDKGPAIPNMPNASGSGRSGGAVRESESERFVKSLQDEAATLGMAGTALKEYRLEHLKMTAAERDAANDSIAKIKRFDAEKKATEEKKKQDTLVLGGIQASAAMAEADTSAITANDNDRSKNWASEAQRLKQATEQINVGMITDTTERAQKQLQIEKRFLDEKISVMNLSEIGRKALIEESDAWYLAKQKQLTEQLKPEWQRMAEAWDDSQRMIRESNDRTVTAMVSAGEQVAIQWGRTGKLSAASFAQTFGDEIIRTLYRKTLGGTVASMTDGLSNSILRMFGGSPAVDGTGDIGSGAFPLPSPVSHRGGVAGHDSLPTRSVAWSTFAGARRYHTGGLPGLGQDEIPTILQKGEEVLTAKDPRHRFNGGGSAGGAGNVKVEIVNQAGVPVQASSAQARFDPEGMVISVVLNDLSVNGPIAQGMASRFASQPH